MRSLQAAYNHATFVHVMYCQYGIGNTASKVLHLAVVQLPGNTGDNRLLTILFLKMLLFNGGIPGSYAICYI